MTFPALPSPPVVVGLDAARYGWYFVPAYTLRLDVYPGLTLPMVCRPCLI